MTCQEKALSNEFVDYIIDFQLPESFVDGIDYCVQPVNEVFNILYMDRNSLPPINLALYEYPNNPNLYGIMQASFDPTALIESGILQVQRQPLSLTGEGVIIAFIDTGERVIIMQGRLNDLVLRKMAG